MAENKTSDRGGFLEGLFWGSLFGLALGILLAPQSGGQTREMIRKTLSDFKEDFDSRVSKPPEVLIKEKKNSIEKDIEKLSKTIKSFEKKEV